MGYINTAQTTEIIDSVAHVVEASQPNHNYWWLLTIGIVPVLIAFFLNRKKTLSVKKGKGKKK